MQAIPSGAWVVVADGTHARLFQNIGEKDVLQLRQADVWTPENVEDSAGTAEDGASDATIVEVDETLFARQLAQRLNAEALDHAFDHLFLVADPSTLGEMRPRLHVEALGAITGDGKNSRLYKALTDKNLSTGVFTGPFLTRDPALFFTFIPLAPGAKHEEVEKIAFEEMERVKKDGVTETELQTAIAKNIADAAFQRDGSFAIAGNLNECIAAGDWTLFYSLEDAMRKVTVADIQRVANTYLDQDQSTTGWFIPLLPPAKK